VSKEHSNSESSSQVKGYDDDSDSSPMSEIESQSYHGSEIDMKKKKPRKSNTDAK
jgi:hypothetical protein